MATTTKVRPEDLPESMKPTKATAQLAEAVTPDHDVDGTDRLAAEFKRHDEVVSEGMARFLEVGKSLIAIRKDDLYRYGGFDTFEKYTKTRHGIERAYAYRLCDAAAIVDDIQQAVSPIGDIPLPTNEAQARELGVVPDDEVGKVWRGVIEDSEERSLPITAKLIREHTAQYRASPDQSATEAFEDVEADDDVEQPDDEPFDEIAATEHLCGLLRAELERWPEDRRVVAADHVVGVLDEYTEVEDTPAE